MPFYTVDASGNVPEAENTRNLPEPLVVAVLDADLERENRTTAVLVHGFRYDHPASSAKIVVPENFITDFASIPAAARFAFSPFGRHAKATVLHDWLYAVGEPDQRWLADQVFRDAMEELGVDRGRRSVMFQAVHLFGGQAYDNAELDWASSWGNWRTGLRTEPPAPRSAYFRKAWVKPPKKSYGPELPGDMPG